LAAAIPDGAIGPGGFPLDAMQGTERLHDPGQKLVDAAIGMVAAVIPQPVIIFVTHDAILSL
jgi:hypothetical protein